jgi:hypothetical protein
MGQDELERWQAEVRALLAIPEGERTRDQHITLWGKRTLLLLRGFRVVLVEGEVAFRYVGNAEHWHELWEEIRKDEIKSWQ